MKRDCSAAGKLIFLGVLFDMYTSLCPVKDPCRMLPTGQVEAQAGSSAQRCRRNLSLHSISTVRHFHFSHSGKRSRGTRSCSWVWDIFHHENKIRSIRRLTQRYCLWPELSLDCRDGDTALPQEKCHLERRDAIFGRESWKVEDIQEVIYVAAGKNAKKYYFSLCF